MIPKVIHYCWFGGNKKPESAEKCIKSWKKYFPDYEIKEWNEDNYDVRKIPFISQAYDAGKYAFVSDFARFDILYEHGGIYFDTDVEVIKSFDDIVAAGAFMGCESDGGKTVDGKPSITVAPGLCLGAEKGMSLYKDIIDYYSGESFLDESGNTTSVVWRVTGLLLKDGLENTDKIQKIRDVTIYPSEYFNPYDYVAGIMKKTENTHSIHWYSMSWLSKREIIKMKLARPVRRFIRRGLK